MFNRRPIDIGQIVPTSKISLKMSCLSACNNDVDAAQKLYAYIASDLKELPDIEPLRPTILQQADSVLGWFGQHREEFAQGLSMIQNLRAQAPAAPPAPPAQVAPPPNPNAV